MAKIDEGIRTCAFETRHDPQNEEALVLGRRRQRATTPTVVTMATGRPANGVIDREKQTETEH